MTLNIKTDEIIYLWDYGKFKERVDMMQQWYTDIADDGILNNQSFIDPWNDVTDGNIKEQQEDEFLSIEDQYTKLKTLVDGLKSKIKDLEGQKSAFYKKNKDAWGAKEKDLDIMMMVLINDEAPTTAEEEELLSRYKKAKDFHKEDLIGWEKTHRELKESNESLKKLQAQLSDVEGHLNELKKLKEEEFDNISVAESLDGRIELLKGHNSEFSKRLEQLQKELAKEKAKIGKFGDNSGCCTIF